jgi:hypothetical protein
MHMQPATWSRFCRNTFAYGLSRTPLCATAGLQCWIAAGCGADCCHFVQSVVCKIVVSACPLRASLPDWFSILQGCAWRPRARIGRDTIARNSCQMQGLRLENLGKLRQPWQWSSRRSHFLLEFVRARPLFQAFLSLMATCLQAIFLLPTTSTSDPSTSNPAS